MLIKSNAFAKGWKCYTVMHKNRRVASVREDGSCTVYSAFLLPYNLWLETGEDIDIRVNNLNNFYYWCASRVLTLDRKYAKEIMNAIGAAQAVTDRERALIAISYHALCLTDVYWVKRAGERVRFEDISLYTNSLSGSFADISLLGKHITAQNAELLTERDIAGDVSTNGIAPKAWIREDGIFRLLKDGDERDVDAELLASRIADCFDIDHVSYSPALFEGRRVSKSRLITSEDISIVPMEFINIYCDNHDLDAERCVLDKDAYSFYMMNIIDYLVGNSDRHWGNWGFAVDNRSNKPLKLYPLMDFNKAFTDYDTPEGGKCQTVKRNISQLECALEAVSKVGLNQTAEISPEWFTSETVREVFFKRLEILKNIGRNRS